MKFAILISFLFLTSTHLFSQKIKTDIEKLKLNGPIKTIYENQFEIIEDSGFLKKGSIVSIIQLNFNREGDVTEQIINNKDWEPVYKISFFYKANRLIKKDVTGLMGLTYSQTTYIYDPYSNSVKESETLLDGSLISRTTSKYDSTGNLIQQSTKNYTMGRQSYDLNFHYDENGSLTEISSNNNNVQFNRETYEYDSIGMLSKTNYFKNYEKQLVVEYKYIMDRLLNWIKLYEIPSIENWNQSFFRERNISYY